MRTSVKDCLYPGLLPGFEIVIPRDVSAFSTQNGFGSSLLRPDLESES